jgi:hypothetical protein
VIAAVLSFDSGLRPPSDRYRLELAGVDQSERAKIRSIRDTISKLLPDSNPTVDPEGYPKLVIIFEKPKDKFDPEDSEAGNKGTSTRRSMGFAQSW